MILRTTLQTLTGIAASLFVFAAVLPAEVYTYTGNVYTVTAGDYTTSESVNATFALTDPLATDLTGFAATAVSWTVTDGINTLCDSCSRTTLTNLTFDTDSMGNITDWYFDAQNSSPVVDVFSAGPAGEGTMFPGTDSATTGTDNALSTVPGTWVDETSAAPEPGTVGMMVAGMVLLVGLHRRRPASPTV